MSDLFSFALGLATGTVLLLWMMAIAMRPGPSGGTQPMVLKPQQWREYANRPRSVETETRRGPLATVGRIAQLLIADWYALHLRFRLVALVIRLLPSMMFGWLRPALYRLGGIYIGPRCRVLGPLDISGEGPTTANVRIGSGCMLTTPLFLNASAPITIGENVSIGHHVVLITDSHRYNDPSNRCGPRIARPVTIERGAWIAACVTILPGVTIGEGSVVGAGSVVKRDVPRHTLVAGVPARVVKTLNQ
jgi:maltose O-acetyltransferase